MQFTLPLPLGRGLRSYATSGGAGQIATGGEGGIRTHGTRKGSTVFETARFNRSRTSPCLLRAVAIVAALVSPSQSDLPFSRPKRCVSIEMLSWAARPTGPETNPHGVENKNRNELYRISRKPPRMGDRR